MKSTLNSTFFTATLLVFILTLLTPVLASKPPLFELKTLDGQNYSLKDDLGKSVIMLDFWATWCKPCLRELPHINKLYNEYKDKGLKAYAISVDDASSKSRVKPTLKRYHFTIPVLLDTSSSVIRKYNPNKNVPFLVLIDREGEIIRTFNGYKPGDEKLVEKLLKEELDKASAKLKTE